MTRADAMRAKIPAPLRAFTRGVWPFVWVGVAAVGALVFFGAPVYDRASNARERASTQERLVASMRSLIATEAAETQRAQALEEWLASDAPARIQAPSVEIGVTRLRERIDALVASAGEGVRLLPDRAGAPQRETLVESMRDGRSLHLVRVPIEVETTTMGAMAVLLDRLESVDELWLRPGNATLSKRVTTRQGDLAELRITGAWALIEVRPEGS